MPAEPGLPAMPGPPAMPGSMSMPGPPAVPMGVQEALLARRVVLLSGELDDAKAADVAAALMTLDALGDEHIELRVTASSGSVEAALVLLDVMEVVGVPVHTVGAGLLAGGSVGVFAAGARRELAAHARLQLREPDLVVGGRASEIERAVAAAADRRQAFLGILARCTGRPRGELEAAWGAGQVLTAEDAVTLGYADAVLG